jgi:hypothetical protein
MGAVRLEVVPVVGLPRYDILGSGDIVSRLTSTSDFGESSASRPDCFTLGEKNPVLNIKCLLGCDALQLGRHMTSLMNVKTVGLSETSVPLYQIARHHMPEDRTLHVADVRT